MLEVMFVMSSLATKADTEPLRNSGTRPRILVVDDEQYMCDVCSRTLRRSGYEVFTTSDPNIAVQLLRSEQHFDLLLTDIRMPVMSGLDLARIAHERDPALAIIIMTGFASIEHLHQSVQRGVTEFLSKPFELEQLRHAVEQALHKRSLLQDSLRLRTLEQLLTSSEALSATLELSELTTTLLRLTLQQSGCRTGFVLVAENGMPPKIVASSTPGSVLLSAGHALAQRASDQQQTVVGVGEAFCIIGDAELTFALVVALRAQGEVNGLLVLCDDHPTALRPGAQGEIALIANYAGAALRNAYLYSQLGEAYQRLQELDRLKSEFIAIASHELRTPLSIVLGYTMMLRDQGVGEQRSYLQRVLENAQRIKDIVDDMVSLRHLETGETGITLEPCVLQELITQASERMRPPAIERQLELIVDLPDQPVICLSDREKILLILGHLLANAIRFTPEGGSINVYASLQPFETLKIETDKYIPAKISPEASDTQWVVVAVQDTGIGIPDREQPRIFERFYQVADSLTRDHGGIGLGLAIVRELVNVLGGIVWVTSQEGKGSTFAFALPYRWE